MSGRKLINCCVACEISKIIVIKLLPDHQIALTCKNDGILCNIMLSIVWKVPDQLTPIHLCGILGQRQIL